jgi:hypothetical protein
LVIAFALCTYALRCQATSIIVVVTGNNIVVASDTKKDWMHAGPNHEKTGNKVVVIENRAALGTTGLGRLGDFDADRFIVGIKDTYCGDTSVSAIERVIKDKLKPFMDGFLAYVADGPVTDKEAFLGSVLVDFIVAGYEKGIPTIDIITLDIDWNSRKVSRPITHSIYPSPNIPVDRNPRPFAFGNHDAIDAALNNTSSKERKAAYTFRGFETGFWGDIRDITTKQAVDIAADTVRFEAEFSPKDVGPPINLVTLSRDGKAVEYQLPK